MYASSSRHEYGRSRDRRRHSTHIPPAASARTTTAADSPHSTTTSPGYPRAALLPADASSTSSEAIPTTMATRLGVPRYCPAAEATATTLTASAAGHHHESVRNAARATAA